MTDVPRNRDVHVLQGDLLTSPADILVCPVNCQGGVLGAGLAKAFVNVFPMLRALHVQAVNSGVLRPGQCVRVRVSHRPCLTTPLAVGATQDILLFPTKNDWREPSRYDWIVTGLASLYPILARVPPHGKRVSLALPALGCGLGGLEAHLVLPLIVGWAAGLPGCYSVQIYEPQEGPCL